MLKLKTLHLLFAALQFFVITQAVAAPATTAALPADSVYQLPIALTDQDGRGFKLIERRGQPVLVSMFYTSCQFVCPMLIETLRATEAQLSAQERARLTVLLVTFDPDKDSVAVLKRTATERGLEPSHWTMARTDAKSVRKFAAALGIQYRLLPNGDFNHSTPLVLLDADGRIAGKTAKLAEADPEFVKLVQGTLAQPAAQ
jgi:protein SCO1/2